MFLSLTLLILFFQNYTPGTWLSGWDNLHPEFNFPLNITRSIFSVWEEYQGLGLLAGMAHAAALPYQLILWFFSILIPTSFLRYFYHFLMITIGTFGTYFLCHHLTRKKLPALIASLFYLLNFGSVQYFSLPFEPYSTFWGTFPWAIFSLFLLLHQPSRRHWPIFAIINVLTIPSFYVQTIFLVYFICILLVLLASRKSYFINLKIIFLIIFINAFWLLPNLYFTFTNAKTTQNAVMNLMITDQFIEQNQYRGNPTSFALLQEPYLDTVDNTVSPSQKLFATWQQHLQNPFIQSLGYLLFFVSLLGLLRSHHYRLPFFLLLLFSATGLLSSTPPFSFINDLLRQVPIISQIFRNSFTKLIVPCLLSLSVFISISLSLLPSLFSILLIPILIIFSLPSFLGNYIHPKMRVAIPPEYFELFSYLQTKNSSLRIADLPQYSFWGWYTHSWGYNGSGFPWYGIKQPIMSRTFDVWNNELENYYWQLHYAIISRDPILFDQVLQKYNIGYVLFDPTINFFDSDNPAKTTLENQKVIDNSTLITLEKKFGNLQLYRVHSNFSPITLATNLPNIKVNENFSSFDPAFLSFGSYSTTNKYQLEFPFASLFSNRPEKLTFTISERNGSLLLDTPTTSNSSFTLQTPPSTSIEFAFDKYHVSGKFQPTWQSCPSQNPTTITATNTNKMSFFDCGSDLESDKSYLLRITNNNTAGRPLILTPFSIQDNRVYFNSKFVQKGLSTQYFVLPPIYQFDRGIGVNLSSLSLSSQPSTNQIKGIDISPFPWTDFVNTKLVQSEISTASTTTNLNTFTHPNPAFYTITLPKNLPSATTLTLNQSFSPGWLAFYFDGLRPVLLRDHILINGWSNGWTLPSDFPDSGFPIPVYVLFWPQLLEFLGFFLLPIPFIVPFLKHRS